jgi:hypothetical protein
VNGGDDNTPSSVPKLRIPMSDDVEQVYADKTGVYEMPEDDRRKETHTLYIVPEVITQTMYHKITSFHSEYEFQSSTNNSRLKEVKKAIEALFECIWFPSFRADSDAYRRSNAGYKKNTVHQLMARRGMLLIDHSESAHYTATELDDIEAGSDTNSVI